MDELIRKLRQIADEMEAGDWCEQDSAVLITRDADNFILTFSQWGVADTDQLLKEAQEARRAEA
jgi:hypothetical protein